MNMHFIINRQLTRTNFSDSPRYLDARVVELILKNVVPHSYQNSE